MANYGYIPQLRFKGFDDNNAPLVGGKLYSYIAGTNTPLPLYVNKTGSPASNPVILNARGEAQVYMGDSFAYKLVLKDVNDVTIWTEDNVTPSGGAAGSSSTDELVKVSAVDELAGYLSNKILAGDGITFNINVGGIAGDSITISTDGKSKVSSTGAYQYLQDAIISANSWINVSNVGDKVVIDASPLVNQFGKVKLDALDSLGYLVDKLIAGTGISFVRVDDTYVINCEAVSLINAIADTATIDLDSTGGTLTANVKDGSIGLTQLNTANVDTRYLPKTFNSTQVLLNTADNSQFVFNSAGQFVTSNATAGYINIRPDSGDILFYKNSNGASGILDGESLLTAPRTWNLPNASGTIALTTDLSGYVLKTGDTMSGALNISNNTGGNLLFLNAGSSNPAQIRFKGNSNTNGWRFGTASDTSGDLIIQNDDTTTTSFRINKTTNNITTSNRVTAGALSSNGDLQVGTTSVFNGNNTHQHASDIRSFYTVNSVTTGQIQAVPNDFRIASVGSGINLSFFTNGASRGFISGTTNEWTFNSIANFSASAIFNGANTHQHASDARSTYRVNSVNIGQLQAVAGTFRVQALDGQNLEFWSNSASRGSISSTNNQWTFNTQINGTAGVFSGNLTAAQFIRSGGLSSQFLKADGSVDSNTYALNSALGNYLPLAGGTLTGSLAVNASGSFYRTNRPEATVETTHFFATRGDGSGQAFSINSFSGSTNNLTRIVQQMDGVNVFDFTKTALTIGVPTTISAATAQSLVLNSTVSGSQIRFLSSDAPANGWRTGISSDANADYIIVNDNLSQVPFRIKRSDSQIQLANVNSGAVVSGGWLGLDSSNNLVKTTAPNPFNQSLNTTNNATFNNLTLTGALSGTSASFSDSIGVRSAPDGNIGLILRGSSLWQGAVRWTADGTNGTTWTAGVYNGGSLWQLNSEGVGNAIQVDKATLATTFSGALSGTSATFSSNIVSTGGAIAGINAQITSAVGSPAYGIMRGGNYRWAFTPQNFGSTDDFALDRYDDAGARIDSPFVVTRSTGTGFFGVRLRVGGGSDDGVNVLQVNGSAIINGTTRTAASTTARAGLNIPHGVAPTTPVNGDIWTVNANSGLLARLNGTTRTIGLLGVTQDWSAIQTARGWAITRQAFTPTGTTQSITLTSGNLLDLILTSSTGNVTVTMSSASAGAESILQVTGHASAARTVSILQASTVIQYNGTVSSAGATVNLGTTPAGGKTTYRLLWITATYVVVHRVSDNLATGFITNTGHNPIVTPWSVGNNANWASATVGMQFNEVATYQTEIKGNSLITVGSNNAVSLYRPTSALDTPVCQDFLLQRNNGSEGVFGRVCGVSKNGTVGSHEGQVHISASVNGSLKTVARFGRYGMRNDWQEVDVTITSIKAGLAWGGVTSGVRSGGIRTDGVNWYLFGIGAEVNGISSTSTGSVTMSVGDTVVVFTCDVRIEFPRTFETTGASDALGTTLQKYEIRKVNGTPNTYTIRLISGGQTISASTVLAAHSNLWAGQVRGDGGFWG